MAKKTYIKRMDNEWTVDDVKLKIVSTHNDEVKRKYLSIWELSDDQLEFSPIVMKK